MTQRAQDYDQADELRSLRALFELPENTVYLDGNSLGALPRSVPAAVLAVVQQQWGRDLIRSWNAHHWIDLPMQVGERIAPLIGAGPGQVVCVDSISVNLFKLLATALSLRPERRVILCAEGDFPTDGYIAQGLSRLLGEARCTLRRVPVESLESALDDEVAVMLLTQVNYRSGECYAMRALTEAAHNAGALALWDLAHSAGVMPLELDALDVDMAVGCGYKYLNGGPGAPAFVYLNERLQNKVEQPLSGWLGHREPFAFTAGYHPAGGILAYQAGTPAIISMAALNAALDVYDHTTVTAIREKSLALTQYFMDGLLECGLLEVFDCVTPTEPERRGSQVSLCHAQAWGISQALIEAGVIVDFRAPDIVRFGFAPLYNSFGDAQAAIDTVQQILADERYLNPRFATRPAVT
jgi:kynureninase